MLGWRGARGSEGDRLVEVALEGYARVKGRADAPAERGQARHATGEGTERGPVRLQRWKHRGEGCEKQLGVGQRTK